MTKIEINEFPRKRKRIINKKECEYDLKEVLLPLFEAYYEALKMYNKEVVQTPPSARPRAFEANLLLAKLIQCVQNHFGSDLKRGKYGRLMLTVNGYIIFFKKLDKNNMPMNIRTVLSDSIENQLQGSLFEDDYDGTSPILFFGYKKDSLGLFVQPKLVYIDEGKVCWEINENNLNSLSKATKTIHPLLPTAEVGIKENVKIKKNVN